MGMAFFNGWELWQKMTFILGLAIFAVFCAAYGKLVWVNRFVKRQEVIDEEKRTRIEALRQSGQMVEAPKGHDIPFGVRAIQSGIQVDGIWISGTNTRRPGEFASNHERSGSSDGLVGVDINKEPKTTVATSNSPSKSIRSSTRQGRPSLQKNESGSSFFEHVDDKNRSIPTGNRKSYQPRKSSHLRYGSHGGFDEATLDRLEGASPTKKKIPTHRPQGSEGRICSESDLSAADNELDSGTSSDSDATFFNYKSAGTIPVASAHSVVQVKSPTQSLLSDPFISPTDTASSSRRPSEQRVTSWYDDTNDVQQSDPKPLSQFVPGELHMNQATRKVNSGFEVLPAGTFGVPIDYKGKGVDRSG